MQIILKDKLGASSFEDLFMSRIIEKIMKIKYYEVKETNENWKRKSIIHRLHRAAKYPVPAILEDTKIMEERNTKWLMKKQNRT